MNKKKLYLIVGGAVLAIALLVVVVGYGGNQVAAPDADIANPGVDDAVDDTLSSGDETGSDDVLNDTTDDTQVADPDAFFEYEPGDKIGDGMIYDPSISVDGYDDILSIIEKFEDDFLTTENGKSIVFHISGSDNITVSKTNSGNVYLDKIIDGVAYSEAYNSSGEILAKVVCRDGVVEYYYENGFDTINITEMTSQKDGKLTKIVKSTNEEVFYEFKVVDGRRYFTYMKSDSNEHFVEYLEKDSAIISKYTVNDFRSGEKLVWTFDGAGNSSANIVSLVRTVNGVTTTYSHDEIPWGAAMIYPVYNPVI